MCDRISTWLKDAAVENGPIPLGARALATRMRDLGTDYIRPDISWCGERRTPRKGLALDRTETIAASHLIGIAANIAESHQPTASPCHPYDRSIPSPPLYRHR